MQSWPGSAPTVASVAALLVAVLVAILLVVLRRRRRHRRSRNGAKKPGRRRRRRGFACAGEDPRGLSSATRRGLRPQSRARRDSRVARGGVAERRRRRAHDHADPPSGSRAVRGGARARRSDGSRGAAPGDRAGARRGEPEGSYGKALGDSRLRRQRRGEDDVDRQACRALSCRRGRGPTGRGRHLPRRGDRSALHLGRTGRARTSCGIRAAPTPRRSHSTA